MSLEIRKVNRLLMYGWITMVVVLIASYTMEIFKGTRPVSYVVVFSAVSGLPLVIS